MSTFSIDEIFKDPKIRHRLTLFKAEDVQWLEEQIFEKNGKPYLKCLASDIDRPAKPEEIVRQLWIKKLIEEYHYPKERLSVEYSVYFGSEVNIKRADIVIMHEEDKQHPYVIFEIKKPRHQDGIRQLKSYCNAEGSPIGAWSNGEELVILHREEPNVFTQISSLPTADQTLQDVIIEQWTIDKLKKEDKLFKERLSFKQLILDLENLVLANAGVDAFEEIFKLIFAKLYDEWAAENIPGRQRKIHFRVYGESPKKLKMKIDNLFNKAKRKWPEVFSRSDRIELSPPHLRTCVSFLQNIRLFNANLQIIDEAFEYLVTQVAKGSKGQYFTPRWVIDMAIKMLNPKAYEYVLDPAAGSCGFLVHTFKWIARGKITARGLPEYVREFAQNNVYAIDFDSKAIKIAKAMNLIAGDGKTHVYKANSLDPKHWPADIKRDFHRFLPNSEEEDFQNLHFDIILTNPPFAGNINEREILRQYHHLVKRNERAVSKISRDILFIERNLNFLRPGGRMAIVLPQGRLNNTNDLYIRKFLFDKARILAVVGLHPNTFKPHTGTKTSIVFLQKYTDEELAEIREVRNRHAAAWEAHLEELKDWAAQGIEEDDAPSLLTAFLDAEFEDEILALEEEPQRQEELREYLDGLQKRLDAMPGRAKGKAALKRTIKATKRKLAALTLQGRLAYLVNEEEPRMLERYRELWLEDQAAKDLDYPIFFAVSERGGKDNSGEPIYKKDENGQPLLDEHGHLIVDHDLDEIADAFIQFAKEQGFDFWAEG